MLFAQIMKYTVFSPFKHCVKRFGCVVVNIATRIFFGQMLYPLVRSIPSTDDLVGLQLVRFKVRAFINKSINNWPQIQNTVVWYRCRPHRAVAFNGYQHSLFFGAFAAFVHDALLISRLATNIFFVKLDDATKRWNQFCAWVHHLSNSVAQLPGAFLRYAHQFAQVHRRYALAGVDNQIHGQYPFPQWQLGTVHGRFGGDGKMVFTAAAFVNTDSHAGTG